MRLQAHKPSILSNERAAGAQKTVTQWLVRSPGLIKDEVSAVDLAFQQTFVF